VSGQPPDIEAEVLHLASGARQRFSGGWTQLGDLAAIRIGGVEVLLNATRTQAFDPALFTDHGIRLDDKKLVVVKSAHHFHAGFAPIAEEVLWLDGPGALTRTSLACPTPACVGRSGRSIRCPRDHGTAAASRNGLAPAADSKDQCANDQRELGTSHDGEDPNRRSSGREGAARFHRE
jgi:hypothetical protein